MKASTKRLVTFLARRSVVSGPESIQLPVRLLANAVNIVKQFAQQAAPGVCPGKGIVRNQIEAAGIACQISISALYLERLSAWNTLTLGTTLA